MSISTQKSVPDLLGIASFDEFLERLWEQRPELAVGGISDIAAAILTVDQFELLVAGAAGSGSGVSWVQDGVARPVVSQGNSNALASAREAYRRGCTLLQASLQSRWPPLAELCGSVENQFHERGLLLAQGIVANAYLTPAGGQGFGIHYDDHCALVLQLKGKKRWTVFPAGEEWPLNRCEKTLTAEELQDPLLEADLEAGDVLYIPRGLPHFAIASEDSSLHVTLGIRTMTWVDIVNRACRALPSLRRSAPAGPHSADLVVSIAAEVESALACWNRDRWEAERAAALSGLTNFPLGGLSAIDGAAQISRETLLRRRLRATCSLTETGEEAVLSFPGAALNLPQEMKTVFDFVAKSEELTASQLPDAGVEYDALQLARILIRRGLLQPVDRSMA